MAWVALLVAGLTEIAWAVGLKWSAGFTRLWPSVWTLVNMVLSFVLLSRALREVPLGTAYAVWTGIGAAGTAAVGMAVFGEPFTLPRVACIGLIVVGIVGLKLVTPG